MVGILVSPCRASARAASRTTTTELTHAERRLIDATGRGAVASYLTGITAYEDPRRGSQWGRDRTLRAEVIYRLVTGGNPAWPVCASGVRIMGARITGFLDLDGTTLRYPVLIERSFIYEPISLQNASSRSISLSGSYIAAVIWPLEFRPADRFCLLADGLKADGSVALDEGFTCEGGVRIADAKINGDLDWRSWSHPEPRRFCTSRCWDCCYRRCETQQRLHCKR